MPPSALNMAVAREHKGKEITQYTFTTRSLEELVEIRSKWYNSKNVRILPKDLDLLIGKISLDHWIILCPWLCKVKGKGGGDGYYNLGYVILCTDNFSLTFAPCQGTKAREEVIRLQKILQDKFNIASSPKKKNIYS